MNQDNEIRKLIDECELMLKNNSVVQTESDYAKYHLEGYNAATILFISKLKDILYRSRIEPSLLDKLKYTE